MDIYMNCFNCFYENRKLTAEQCHNHFKEKGKNESQQKSLTS